MDFEKYNYINPNIFHVVERKDSPNWGFGRRQSGFHELYFMVGGKSVFHVNDETFIAQTGDIVYIPGGSVREAHTFKDCPMHAFAINFHLLDDNHLILPFETILKNKFTKEILGFLKELTQVWIKKPVFYKCKERGLFLLILNQLINSCHDKSQPHMDPRIRAVLEFMATHFQEDIDIKMLARMTNLHSVYLGKLFKENTGYTFKAYLNRIRVNNAEQMLSAGQFSVSEVAEQCGFKDIYYFSKVFKSTKGYAPSTVYSSGARANHS